MHVGLAGRSGERLDDLRRTLPDAARAWPLIVTDTGKPEILNRLASGTRVMISTVGPYAAYGLPVVATFSTSSATNVHTATRSAVISMRGSARCPLFICWPTQPARTAPWSVIICAATALIALANWCTPCAR